MDHVGNVHVLGCYWHPERSTRTDIGELVHRAKDRADDTASAELAARFAGLAGCVVSQAADAAPMVVPVPSRPAAMTGRGGEHLAAVLARALAEGGAGTYCPGVLVRCRDTPRLRGTDPSERAEAVARAGYEVRAPVEGRHVVLVDDVILTGATLAAVAGRLLEAGAASVTAAVAARTRMHI